jgi:ADP-heptose:LPS heptosyltransferase
MLFSAFDDQDTDIPNYSLVDLAKIVLAKPNDLCNRQYPYISPKQDSKDFRRGKKKVGLSWRSFKIDLSADKSIPLELLLKTLRNYDCDLVSLQYGDSKSDILAPTDGDHVTSLIEENIDLTQDLDGVLSIIVSCDLIITSSSSVAHIAGAVGARTILLLPFGIAKHWYWYAQDDQGNSLWYPSIRILGQSNGSSWEEPLAQLGNILNNESLVG